MDSPVSKFVATSTDTSWAQSYSAGKLNIVLSLEGNVEGVEITSLGKDTLEKLQREFFVIDQKNLESLKKLIGEVAKTVPSEITLSLVLATAVDDILYVVIAEPGYAVLKRGKTTSVIAQGKKGEILGFSGRLQPQDTILIGTADLFKTISPSDIGQALHLPTPDEVSENLAPYLHEKAKGTEAGIIWKVPGLLIKEAETETQEIGQIEEKQKSYLSSFLTEVIAGILKMDRKYLIITAVVILVVFLIGSIFIEKNSRKQNEELKATQELIDQNKPKYEDSIALMSINKSLALDDLTDVKNAIEEGSKKFPANSAAGKKLQEFLNEINNALGGEGGTSEISLFYNSSDKGVKNVSAVSTKGKIISVVGDGKGGTVSSGGDIEETFDIGDAKGLTVDKDNIFVLSEKKVLKISRGNFKTDSIIDTDNSPISVDTFGGNIYLLSKNDKTIYRYRPNNFSEEKYLSPDIELSNPSSMAIDSSVYVIDSGKIRKFTRGNEDNFSIKKEGNFSMSSKIFTDIDYANLYVVDPDKKAVYVINKTGNQLNEFSLKGLKELTSIAANEKDKKIYVAANGNIYSISF